MIALFFIGAIAVLFGIFIILDAAHIDTRNFGFCVSVFGLVMALAAIVQAIAGWMA